MVLALGGLTISGASPGFSPLSLFTGAQGWYFDPSDLSTVFQDSAGTTPGAVGQPVGLIRDKSGNGNHATQSTAASRPILRQSGSLYYLEFDGVDDFLATSAINLTASDEMSVFAGLRKLSDAATQVAIENTTGSGSFRIYVPSGGSNWTYGSGGTTGIDNTASGYTAPATSVISGLTKISTPSGILRVNAVQKSTSPTSMGTGNFGNFALYIGRRSGTTLPFSGYMFASVGINRLVSAAELGQTEAWVNSKTAAY